MGEKEIVNKKEIETRDRDRENKEINNYMNTNENENMRNMEKNENKTMDEKVHYEIKFVETEDGYHLVATGDKKALKRLGIGPNMFGRKRRGGHRGNRNWARARHARRMHRRPEGMRGPDRFEQGPGPESFGFAEGPHRRSRRMHGRHDGHGHGRPQGKNRPDFGQITWEW